MPHGQGAKHNPSFHVLYIPDASTMTSTSTFYLCRFVTRVQAWFDEARADNAAHSYGAECGAMGNCDHNTGECVCRDGWTGTACERLSCANGCSGNGACLPMYRLAQLRETNGEPDPQIYGITALIKPFGTSVYTSPATWDFDMMYGCLCDSGGRDFGADDDENSGGGTRPRVGTRGFLSGVYTDNSLLSGWGGYKCDQRECVVKSIARQKR